MREPSQVFSALWWSFLCLCRDPLVADFVFPWSTHYSSCIAFVLELQLVLCPVCCHSDLSRLWSIRQHITSVMPKMRNRSLLQPFPFSNSITSLCNSSRLRLLMQYQLFLSLPVIIVTWYIHFDESTDISGEFTDVKVSSRITYMCGRSLYSQSPGHLPLTMCYLELSGLH